jgi:hypothetical protein
VKGSVAPGTAAERRAAILARRHVTQ